MLHSHRHSIEKHKKHFNFKLKIHVLKKSGWFLTDLSEIQRGCFISTDEVAAFGLKQNMRNDKLETINVKAYNNSFICKAYYIKFKYGWLLD